MISLRRPVVAVAWLAAGAVFVQAAHAPPAQAVTTRTFRVATYQEFDEGETQGVLLSSLGQVSAGFTATRVDFPEAQAQVYASAVAGDGSVWLGTGDEACLYRYLPATGLKRIAQLDGVLVTALTTAADGTLYAATLPDARLWTVRGDTVRPLATLEGAEHIWALVVSGKTLYAATGPSGRLYAVDRTSGKSHLHWDSGEKHILSLIEDGAGGLLAGTGNEAILYHVGADGSARVIHDFEGEEVHALTRRGDVIYAAVNEFETGSGPPPAAKPKGTKIVVPPASSSASAATVDATRQRKGKGAIYRIDPNGRVEQLHALGDGYFTALHVDATGDLYAAAGSRGRLYLVRPDRTVITAFDFPERQILTLAFNGRHPVLGTGDAGALYRIAFKPPADAHYLSKVLDASFRARWGIVRWRSQGDVRLETRAGNTARPDKSWSAWQAPEHSPAHDGSSEGAIASPQGRYLQFRARFPGDAILRDVTVYYLPQNQPPRVTDISLADNAPPKGASPPSATRSSKAHSPVLKLRWKVDNPDDDELAYRLSYREERDSTWKPLGGPEPLTAREYDWNTEAVPDGNYVVKVSASDERSSPREDALEHALVSAPLLVDNRKPDIKSLSVAYPTASGTAQDGFSPISELAYAIDGGEWHVLAPRDGILDELDEEFVLRLPGDLSAGTHSLAVRASDAADNLGVFQVSFHVK